MSLTIANIQLDVPGERYDEVVAFWATALSATSRQVDTTFTRLVDPTAELGFHVQRLPEGDPAGAHLDVETDDADAEVARLVALGARETGRWDTVTVLTDPAALRFCVVADRIEERLAPRDRARAFLDAVVLDVPADVDAATAAFWAEALGVAPFERQRPGDPYLWSDGLRTTAGALDLGVQRLGDDAHARIHLDTISDDVTGEVARLTAAGASVVTELPRWTVLADPVGTLFCVVDASGGPAADGGAA